MDLDFFQNKIEEELCDSHSYIKKAIEIKAMNPEWGKYYVSMGKNELEHATQLYKMFNEYYVKLSTSYRELPKYIIQKKEEVDSNYTDKLPKIASLQAAYDKL